MRARRVGHRGRAAEAQTRYADMKHRGAILGIVAVLVLAGGLVTYVFTPVPPQLFSCGNEIVSEHPSPSDETTAILFERDCGTTTDFSTQVSVLSRDVPLPAEAANVFIADTDRGAAPAAWWGGPEVRIQWLSPDTLSVEHHAKARIFKQESRVGTVVVRYSAFRVKPHNKR